MAEFREWLRKLVAGTFMGACVIMLLGGISALWDYNENAYDTKMNRLYYEMDPAPDYYWEEKMYMGNKETGVFHNKGYYILVSDYADRPPPNDWDLFYTPEEAIQKGYTACPKCKKVGLLTVR